MSAPTPSTVDERGRIWFLNTFLPKLDNEIITVGGIIMLLTMGAAKEDQLPDDVRKAVNDEMRRRYAAQEARKKNEQRS